MKRVFFLLPALALAACATPQEQCINRANHNLVVLNQLIAKTQGNIARGYAIVEKEEVSIIDKTCAAAQPDGTTIYVPCQDSVVETKKVPTAIDLNTENSKLQSLITRRNQDQQGVQNAIQQCRIAYPE